VSDNPFKAPDAELSRPVEQLGGSIEQTLAGDAVLDFRDVVVEAWQKTRGIKGIVIGGALLIYLGVMVVGVVVAALVGFESGAIVLNAIVQVVAMLLIYPFFAGVLMLGLRQSVGLDVQFAQQFAHYGAAGGIVAIALLQAVATYIGFLLLIVPGLYLMFAVSLAIPLRVEKNLGVRDSLFMSMRLVNTRFVTVALLAVFAWVVMVLSFATVIGWIWAIPWMLMVYSITYRQLAGVEVGV
jgi:hypothetical protein